MAGPLWLIPGLRTLLLIVIAMTQVNLIAFSGLTGELGYSRMLGGIDATIPLAGLTLLVCCFVAIRMLPYIAASRCATRTPVR
jgi:F0F1-type ATP synthase assembly protein I